MTSGSSPSFLPRGARPRIAYSPTIEPAPSSTLGPTIAVLWMSTPRLVMPNSRSDRLLERDARAILTKRAVRGLEHANDAHAGLAIAARGHTVADALDEVAHLELQRLGQCDARAVDVTRAVATPQLVGRKLGDAVVV